MYKLISFLIFCLIIVNTRLFSQSNQIWQDKSLSKWTFVTSVQITGGKYIYGEYSRLYFLTGGVRYKNGNLSVSAYLPVITQNNSAFTQSGSLVMPTGMRNHDGGTDGGDRGDGGMGGGWVGMGKSGVITTRLSDMGPGMGSTSQMITDMQVSLGDLFLYSSYQLLKEYKNSIDLFINPNIKFPTATNGIGTGQFDFGASLYIRKSISSYTIAADAGFLKFGDPKGIDYKNPFTYGIGLGKYLSDDGNSVLLYYSSYTGVLEGYEPPRLLSLGFNFSIAQTNILSFVVSKGLSNYSPDFSITGGFNFSL